MSKQLKLAIRLTTLLLWLSGLAYAVPFYADQWFFWDLGNITNPSYLMTIHGMAGMVIIFQLGIVWRGHIYIHLRRQYRFSGWLMMTLMLLLVLSGYFLYYGSAENMREVVTGTHTLLGIVLPFMLWIHVASASIQPGARANQLTRQPLLRVHQHL